jgi:tRNA(Ile)-lysidine synthase
VRSTLSKRDPVVAAVLRGWRGLTGGAGVSDASRAVLVACSGGPDSVGLALALHAAGGLAGLAHVVHDLRPEPDARADADAVRDLAASLGVSFHERSVRVRQASGNLEANARRARYAALADAASQQGVRFVATAHHADDQLETIVMRLARGCGVRGLRATAARRRLAANVILIRPCLSVTRADLAGLCAQAGVTPRHDPTNDDLALARNVIRARIVPELERLYPGVRRRADDFAKRMRLADAALAHAADTLLSRARRGPEEFDRATLAEAPPAVLMDALRRVVPASAGRSLSRSLASASRAIRDGAGHDRDLALGGALLRLRKASLTIVPA